MAVDEGQGTTVTFGTSGFTANYTNVEVGEISREAIETTHLGTTNAKTYKPADLYDPPEITFDIQYDPASQPPYAGAAETITVTYPGSETIAGSGFVISFTPGTVTTDELMSGSVTVKIADEVTFA